MVPRIARKGVRDILHSHSLGSQKNTKLHNNNAYAEGLVQSNTGSLMIGSVYVRPYEPHLVDAVGCFLVVYSVSLAPGILPHPLLLGSPCSPIVWVCVFASAPISY